ncbi:uncharacterized protein LOC122365668 [Amphibalanus amphitrite]|uniref:uncharacterized protein LOC122365668 n=1 Tax=Amphibalanus amphitrite TaxID=1232801 RepID=UPI001C920E21|nr:uncharacterized protein LOC122365668 [Amphibalanus amphitrite]
MAPSAVLLLCLTMAAGTAAAEVAPTADVAADLEAPPPVSEGELPFLDYEDPPEDPAGDELTAEVTDPAGEEPGPEIVEGEQPAVVEDDGLEDDDILKDQPDDAASETQEKSEDAAGLAEEKETVELSEVEDRLSHEEKEEATAETHPEHSKEGSADVSDAEFDSHHEVLEQPLEEGAQGEEEDHEGSTDGRKKESEPDNFETGDHHAPEERLQIDVSEENQQTSHDQHEDSETDHDPDTDADDDTADSGEQLPSELWSPSIHVAAVEVGSAEPVRDESAAPASLQAPSSGTFDSSALASAPVEFSVKEGGSLILPCGSAMMTKSSVRWYRSGRPLFQGQSSLSADGRLHLLADGSLRLTSASTQDDGMFTCRAYGDEGAFTETSHRVHVRSREEALKEEAGRTLGSAPSLQVVTEPADGVRIVERDEATSLSCWAPGQPRATVTWTKQEGNLPYGESMLRGPRLDIGKVMPAHRGTYRCTVTTADNRTETRTLLLQVNFAPEVTAPEPEVHSGEDHQAVLNCRVEAHPPAKVHWRRTSGRPLRPGHHLQTQEDGMFRLTMLVESEDLDTYVCEAENSLGRAEAPVVLTGRPGRPVVTSPARGSESETYTLRWWAPSFPPLMAYKLIYRRRITDANRPVGYWRTAWLETVIPLEEEEEDSYEDKNAAEDDLDDAADDGYNSHQYVIRKLKPQSEYEVNVLAQNKHGWSKPSEKFVFRTAPGSGKGPVRQTQHNSAGTLGGGNPAVCARAGPATLLLGLAAGLLLRP